MNVGLTQVDLSKKINETTTRGGRGVPTSPVTKQSAHTQRRKSRGGDISDRRPTGNTRRALYTIRQEGSRESCSRVMAPTKLAKQTRKVAPQNAAAAHRLARWYAKGEEGLSQDTELALTWERQAAELGCADAQCELGVGYLDGHAGMQVDHAIAFAWLQKAALQGRAYPTYTSPFFSSLT